MIEYVLILVISVSIVLALISQIFRPFGDFLDSYMGSYVGCLLEYGELPSLGSPDPAKAEEDSECNKKFKAASLTEGRSPASNSKNQRGDGNGQSQDNTSSGRGGSSRNNEGSSGGTYAGSSSRGGSRNINYNRRPSSGVESGSSKAGGKVIELATDGPGGNSFFGSRGGSSRQFNMAQKNRSIGISGLTESERKKLEKKVNEGRSVMTVSEEMKPPPKKIPVKKPQEKVTMKEEEPLTVGNFIRYLFIAAVIIALVLLVGGQALQLSKSSEK